MKFDDLLEKKEAKQLKLLRRLILNGGSLGITFLSQELNMSKSSVESYIDDLSWIQKKYQAHVKLTYDGMVVTLELDDSFSLEMIEISLYKQSIKYQILDYLYHHFEYSTVLLTQKIGISESTLFRKIKELNQTLKEFGLTIWQGKLIGEESQIRYFYYLFYWHLDNYSQQPITQKQQTMIETVERGLNISFPTENRQRVNLWLLISKKRLTYPSPVYVELRKKFKPYETDSLFLGLKSIVLRVLGHYAVEIDEEEAMIHYMFLASFQSLTQKDFLHYSIVRSKFTPVGMIDTYILESIILYYAPNKLPHQLEQKVTYLLSRIHSRLYFFRGVIEVLSRKDILDKEKEWSGHVIYPLVEQLFSTIENDFEGITVEQNASLIAYSKLQYLHVIALIDHEINHTVRIGVKLLLEDIYEEASTIRLINQLNGITGVKCEKYQSHQSVDLIISNKALNSINARLYVISELGTTYDIMQIRQLIREISMQKMTKKKVIKKIQA